MTFLVRVLSPLKKTVYLMLFNCTFGKVKMLNFTFGMILRNIFRSRNNNNCKLIC